MNWRSVVALAGIAVLALSGCGKTQKGAAELGDAKGSVAGLNWGVPKQWTLKTPTPPMRAASYIVPPASGDAEGGDVAVFYFGADQGGSVDMNIDRWFGQFENAGTPKKDMKDVGGIKVNMVEIAGAYLAPGGPMMSSSGKKDNYKLLGAIVEGPQGLVFFKFTGPAKTVDEQTANFNALVGSISK
jgi:hypothetical protein